MLLGHGELVAEREREVSKFRALEKSARFRLLLAYFRSLGVFGFTKEIGETVSFSASVTN